MVFYSDFTVQLVLIKDRKIADASKANHKADVLYRCSGESTISLRNRLNMKLIIR